MPADHAPLRPGPILGPYPERDAPKAGKLDELAGRAGGILRGSFPKGPGRFAPMVRRVVSQGNAFESLPDEALAEAIREAHQRLRREGLTAAASIRAFALIREQAHRTLGMRHYDVQILGGWVILQGLVAEMQTGEGKTLTATLPAAAAAMAGIPVHIVTVNDYLVGRDAAWMGPLYRALGLSVGTIVEGMGHGERRAAYACDIVYCTNKQLVFDYLRDRMVRGGVKGMRMRLDGLFGEGSIGDKLLLRGLCFGILDEADSVLIDEARTPLIISRSGEPAGGERIYHQALDLAARLEPEVDYRLDLVRREVELTASGKGRLPILVGEMPDAGAVWGGSRRREELVSQALYARECLIRDIHYLVKDNKVQIIDSYTGRLMPDRSWERGLHQLVEAKEGCQIRAQTETLAKISFQRFFRRYLRLAGMTGTAREVVGELWSVYQLDVMAIPPNRPVRRKAISGRVYPSPDLKWQAVVEQIRAQHEKGVPMLVGTASVGASEHLSELLNNAGIEHRVLNARQDGHEAETIAYAGQLGQVTVATNMAGRGTDIKLGPGVSELGGLFVLATERHEAGRIDRQLYGRTGRQGDPGCYQYLVSLEDDLVTNNGWSRLARFVSGHWPGSVALFGPLIINLSQWAAERRHAKIRWQLLKLDEQTGKLLAFSGQME